MHISESQTYRRDIICLFEWVRFAYLLPAVCIELLTLCVCVCVSFFNVSFISLPLPLIAHIEIQFHTHIYYDERVSTRARARASFTSFQNLMYFVHFSAINQTPQKKQRRKKPFDIIVVENGEHFFPASNPIWKCIAPFI